jgi:hypothetical protein
MHPNAKAQFVEQLLGIAQGAKDQAAQYERHVGANIGHGFFAISGTGLETFEAVAQKLLVGEGYEHTVSDGFLTSNLLDVIGELRVQPVKERAAQVFDSFLDILQKAIREFAVYVPIDGLKVDVEEIELGAIRLTTMDAKKLDGVLGSSKHVFAGPSNDVLDRSVALFRCSAEKQRAIDRAKEEANRVLDILRFSIPFLADFNYSRDVLTFGIQGSVPSYLTCTVFFREQGKPGADLDVNITGPVPFTLNKATLARFEKIGAFRLSATLRKPMPDQSDFERVLLRGVHWFANAQVQRERENELLNLVTCLETFLTPRDGNPIGTAIAEGIALLLETDLNARKRMKKTVQNLYRLRSGVSHGGEKAVSDADLQELREISKRLVARMIQLADHTTSQKDLLQRIEDLKLT